MASDHAGFELKKQLIERLPAIEWVDAGTDTLESVDYPDFAAKAANEVEAGRVLFGILICGSG
ncbi:MAG: RpiB/LacA/LacB family sugar-phosphate isomerase, partial [Hyphomicrobiales bacterium]